MTVSLKHAFQSAKSDGADSSLVQPSNWNAEHTLTLATNKLIGRATAGTGAAEEIAIGTALSISGGTLAVTTVPVANGGTGTTSLTANNVLLGNGTSAVQVVAPSTSGNVLTSNGTTWVSQAPTSAAGNLLRITVFTSSGTWTKGANTKNVYTYGVGGGGGGYTSGGGGAIAGGAGAYCQEFIDVSAVSTVSVTVGSAGAGSTSTGTNGGSSSFGAYWTAGGGSGVASGASSGAGGTATGGDLNVPGASSSKDNNGVGVASYFGGPRAYGSSCISAASYTASDGNGYPGVVVVEEYA